MESLYIWYHDSASTEIGIGGAIYEGRVMATLAGTKDCGVRLILIDAKIRISAFFAYAQICLFEIRFLSKCDASHLCKL
jgi:hypothetical protein